MRCSECGYAREGNGEVVYCRRKDGWVWADNRHGCERGRGRDDGGRGIDAQGVER